MGMAYLASMRSKDPQTQVGACIVNEDKIIVGIGYNGFPQGCSDDHFPWTKNQPDMLQSKFLYGIIKYLSLIFKIPSKILLSLHYLMKG